MPLAHGENCETQRLESDKSGWWLQASITACGAVAAAVRAEPVPGQFSSLVKQNKVIMAGGMFDLETGRVRAVGIE